MLVSLQDGNTYFQAGMYNDAAAKYKKVSRGEGMFWWWGAHVMLVGTMGVQMILCVT